MLSKYMESNCKEKTYLTSKHSNSQDNMKLVFVYNANSGMLSQLVDFAHKIFKPSTYKCELCALTHHSLGERLMWKVFKRGSDADLNFYYIPEFQEKYKVSFDYPVILVENNNSLSVLMNKDELRGIKDLEELITQLEDRIKE